MEDERQPDDSDSIPPDISLGRRKPLSSEQGRPPRESAAPRVLDERSQSTAQADEDNRTISLNYRSSRPWRSGDDEVLAPPPSPRVEVRRAEQRPVESRPTQEVRNRRVTQEEPRSSGPLPPPASPPRMPTEQRTAGKPPEKEFRRGRPEPTARTPQTNIPQYAAPVEEIAPLADVNHPSAPRAGASSRELESLLRSREEYSAASYKEWGIAIFMMLASAAVGLLIGNLS